MRRVLACLALLAQAPLVAQDARDERHYAPGAFNWAFLARYPDAGRLFNAFDYGHAVLYERLLTLDSARATAALAEDYRFLTEDLLVRPPRLAVAEEAIAPAYSKLVWPAKQFFDRAHVLHRQIYDIYAMDGVDRAARDTLIERVIDAYLADERYAFTAVPKSMMLMDEQPFSQRFRLDHPVFNGLIWSYHWLQVGLYEPLLPGATPAERAAGVRRVLAGFRAMISAPDRMPKTMPMTAEVSPRFAAAHPRAAAIFDNLHIMHDIISDILAQPDWTRGEKRAEILRQMDEMRDGTRNLMAPDGHQHAGGP
jgi:hypothetical protein